MLGAVKDSLPAEKSHAWASRVRQRSRNARDAFLGVRGCAVNFGSVHAEPMGLMRMLLVECTMA